ncbi:MAG: NAD(P)/FAD-dependent oxidoreductase [Pseudomonadota bacterium]
MVETWDCVIIGAGAAGMFCGTEMARRGLRVLVLDHAKAPGEKIRISGGGRCNFTNIHTVPERFISANPRFAISALRRFTPQDFIDRVEAHGIAYHEKTLGQLFCDRSSKDIIGMLVRDLRAAGGHLRLGVEVTLPEPAAEGYRLTAGGVDLVAARVVVATGGKSVPKMGATGFGYAVAERFGLALEETRPGLVPLTFSGAVLERMKALTGVSSDAAVRIGDIAFREALLFTHRGLSGPSILQISSYWREGQAVSVEWVSAEEAFAALRAARQTNGRQSIATALAALLPKRLADDLLAELGEAGRLGDMSDARLRKLALALSAWQVLPSGSEGYRTAEVTLGGVSTSELSSKTMEARRQPGLYFIGEVVDVTGWLGGYNFQWAWASGWAAGQIA